MHELIRGRGPGLQRRMEWSQPHRRRSEWQLSSDGRAFASLRFSGRLHETAEAKSPSGGWRFHRRWTGAAEIVREGAGLPAARYAPGLLRGSIATAGGLRYGWERSGLTHARYAVVSDSGFECLSFEPQSGWLGRGGTVTIEPLGLRNAELEPLLLLAWRLVLGDR